MIVYHGTTSRRARRICAEGFLPKKPSRRVWFAQSKGYALGRARTQARRTRDAAVVLRCDLDLDEMRKRIGAKKVFRRGGVIAIDAHVPASALDSYPGWVEQPTTPDELARWVNDVLQLRPHKGVGSRHPGIDRLSRWVVNRMTSRPDSTIRPRELLGMARQWLSELFADVEIDPETLHTRRRVSTIQVRVEAPEERADPREDEALDCLASEKPARRVRGLGLLADIGDPDLFDWCAMFLEDDSPEVTAEALHTMLSCEEGDPEVIAPFAESEDKRVRAAATAALAKHGGAEAPQWLERGLKDPETCVRFAVSAVLPEVDPMEHREIFELALYDPNPEIRRRARTLTEGKGFEREGARWGGPRV
jgi:hypothetical protein